MLSINEQISQFCGFLSFNDFGAFVYHCTHCECEFLSCHELEVHILCEHQEDVKKNIQHIFVSDGASGSLPSTVTTTSDQLTNNSVVHKETSIEQIELNSIPIETPLPNNRIESNDSMKSQIIDSKTNSSEMLIEKSQPKTIKSIKTKQYYCDLCADLSFKTLTAVKKHMKIHIANKVRKWCTICCILSYDYEKHMRLNHTCRPYQCAFCVASFTTNSHRMEHLRVHTDERPFLCETCGIAFKSQNTKRKHDMTIHWKTLPHRCIKCNKTFLIPSHLQDHINSQHSNIRSHICEVCGKAFSTRMYLRKHKLIHGERKFPCKFCNKSFKTWDTRHLHQKSIHRFA